MPTATDPHQLEALSHELALGAFEQTIARGHAYAVVPGEFRYQAGFSYSHLIELAHAAGRCGHHDVDQAQELCRFCLLEGGHDGDHGWPADYAAGMLREQVDPIARLARRLPHLAELIRPSS